MMKNKFFVLLALYIISMGCFATNLPLANYLGDGCNPQLILSLSDNEAKWDPYSINYGSKGNVPTGWSTWNITDNAKKYYGTITLVSDGTRLNETYKKPSEGDNYLEGVKLSYSFTEKVYQLSVEKVIGQFTSCSPFPNAPIAKPAVYPNSSTKVILSAEGPNIINNQGQIIILKGMVIPSLEWNKQGQNLSVKNIKTIREWGSNVIRIDLKQDFWFASKPATETGSYKQIINALVHYATENNMAVILDLHWTNEEKQPPMANKESVRFWKEVASDYKDFGTVIFELFNEPEGINQATWLNGNSTYAGYQELYNAVRSAGSDNLVIVNGLGWGYNLNFVKDNFRVKGNNIVYGSHPYNRTSFEDNFTSVLGKYPVIFTEFGVNDAQSYENGSFVSVYQSVLDLANKNQFSYTGFAWWVGADAFPSLIKDWSGTPINGGVLIHDDMKIHPGSSLF